MHVDPETKLQEAITLLTHKSSPKRRAAAKTLRKLARPEAGPHLFAAFRIETSDPRTWETQYQLIMALATCLHTPALPELQSFAAKTHEATMLYTAVGDAIVRLARSSPQDPQPVLDILKSGNDRLIDGALRAVAQLRLTLDPPAINEIIAFASALPINDGLRFWPAAAAPGWHGPNVEAYLVKCLESSREDVRLAATLALKGQYKQWSPL